MPPLPGFVKPSEGRVVAVAGGAYRLILTGNETDGAFSLVEFVVPPGSGPPPHVHRREDETFYIIEGEMTFYVDGKAIKAPAGGTVRAVRDIPHWFRNETDQPVRALTLISPAGFENFFLEVGTPLASMSQEPPAPTQQDINKLLATAPRYGLEILSES